MHWLQSGVLDILRIHYAHTRLRLALRVKATLVLIGSLIFSQPIDISVTYPLRSAYHSQQHRRHTHTVPEIKR